MSDIVLSTMATTVNKKFLLAKSLQSSEEGQTIEKYNTGHVRINAVKKKQYRK